MAVVLKVVGGKNDGREIAIAVPRFIIGRGETAHLRPASDLVSREHCAIEVADGRVTIVDLNSRNGTFVNGTQLTGSLVARSGDSVRIGRLQFQIVVDPAKSEKKPKVAGVLDAASRTAKSKKSSLDDSISDWLMEEDDDSEDTGERNKIASSETIQLEFAETTAFGTPKKTDDADEISSEDSLNDSGEPDSVEETDAQTGKKKKSKPKKLPPLPKTKHESSTSAADDVLKKFFNRR